MSQPPSGLRQELRLTGCLVVAEALRAKGYRLGYREYDGGPRPGLLA